MASLGIIEQAEGVIHLEIHTSRGTVEIMGNFTWDPASAIWTLNAVHIEGAGPGILGRGGLNELKAALADFGGQQGAKAVMIQGAMRTTGRFAGRIPSPILIPILSR